jgi:hypothetical protein
MKGNFAARGLLLLLAAFCLAPLVGQATRKTVRVSSPDQLIKAVASDTEVVLRPGTYDLSKAQRRDTQYVKWIDGAGGPELVLRGLKNFSMRGEDTENASSITVANPYVAVVALENCQDVELSALNMRHLQSGSCSAAVLRIFGCSDMKLGDLLLEGSGALGLDVQQTTGLAAYGVTVAKCTSGALLASDSSNLFFSGCLIQDCMAYPLVMAAGCAEVEFQGSAFERNRGNLVAAHYGSPDEYLAFVDCEFTDNEIRSWSDGEAPVESSGCLFSGNSFEEPTQGYRGPFSEDGGYDNPEALYFYSPVAELGFSYPARWILDQPDAGSQEAESGMAALYDEENGVACLFIPVGQVSADANMQKGAAAVFAKAAADLKAFLRDEMGSQAELSAQGSPIGEGLDIYAYYEGSLVLGGERGALRCKFMVSGGVVWVLMAMAQEPGLFGFGSEAGLILESLGRPAE